MQESSVVEAVTSKCERKRRRRKGLEYSLRRALLRSRMVKKQARSIGANLEGTVRTLTYITSTSTGLLEDNCIANLDVELKDQHQPLLRVAEKVSFKREGIAQDAGEMMYESYVRRENSIPTLPQCHFASIIISYD